MYTPKTFNVALQLSGYSRAAAVRLLRQGAQVKLELAAATFRANSLTSVAEHSELLACAAELQAAADAIREAR